MKQKITWIRIVNACNSKCLFCLDSNAHNSSIIPKEQIKKLMREGFIGGEFNKIVISGGEASINPDFAEYIAYAKEIGYQKIQTITNGQRFESLDFCKKVVEAGLQEITFSIHGHNKELHDYLTGVKGSYEKAIKGLINIKKHFSLVIVNIDMVLNRLNIDYIPSMIRFFNKLGVYEFDLLQVIPFGRAYDKKEVLFYDPKEKFHIFKEIGELSKIPGMYIWTNRLPAEILEGYENLIQDPEKIRGEVLGEAKDGFTRFFTSRKKMECNGDRCKNCFIEDFCDGIIAAGVPGIKRDSAIINEIDDGSVPKEGFLVLKGEMNLDDIYRKFGATKEEFLGKINSIKLRDDQRFINVPMCIRISNNDLEFETYDDLKNDDTITEYTDKYILELYRKKSLRCRECKFDDKCRGLHINFIKAYGFKLLNPIRGI